MKLSIATLFLVAFISSDSFQQQLPYRTPSGQFIGARRASGVKGGQSAPSPFYGVKQIRQQQIVDDAPIATDQCAGVTVKDVDDEAAAALHALDLHGDRNHKLSFQDDHHDDHCEESQKNLRVFLEHVNCIPGEHGKALKVIGEGFKKAVHKRCTSKQWHSEYIKFSHCIYQPGIYDEFHTCKDKFGASQEYILRNIGADDQAFVLTCDIVPRMEVCLKSYVSTHCGQQAANFIVNSIWEPYNEYMRHSVGGDFNRLCYSKYPNAVRDFDTIWATRQRELPLGWWKLFFKIADNSYKNEVTPIRRPVVPSRPQTAPIRRAMKLYRRVNSGDVQL